MAKNNCLNCAWCSYCESWGEFKCNLRYMRLYNTEITDCSDYKKRTLAKDPDECHCNTCDDMRASGMIEEDEENG